MDEERIGLVLAKTSELRPKIINRVHETSPKIERESGNSESKESGASPDAESQDYDGEEEEVETLLKIKDALESLQGHAFSLQALQQQQWYETEAALSEIEFSQKKLLEELKQYKGKDLQVIHKAISFFTLATNDNHETAPNIERESGNSESKESGASQDAESQDYDGEEEVETLLKIKDALESLEGQAVSLQALQQQHRYRKEAALSEIEYSQKKLLEALKQCKGKDLQAIHNAISFATLATNDNHDLLLPPSPSGSHPLHPINPENGPPTNPDNGPGGDPRPNGMWGLLRSVGGMIETALAIAGVVGVLSLVAFEPHMRKRDNGFIKMLRLFRVNGEKGRGGSGGADECPTGTSLEEGELKLEGLKLLDLEGVYLVFDDLIQ